MVLGLKDLNYKSLCSGHRTEEIFTGSQHAETYIDKIEKGWLDAIVLLHTPSPKFYWEVALEFWGSPSDQKGVWDEIHCLQALLNPVISSAYLVFYSHFLCARQGKGKKQLCIILEMSFASSPSPCPYGFWSLILTTSRAVVVCTFDQKREGGWSRW